MNANTSMCRYYKLRQRKDTPIGTANCFTFRDKIERPRLVTSVDDRRRQIVNNGGKQMSTYVDSAVRMEGETRKNIAVINPSFNELPNSPFQNRCQSP